MEELQEADVLWPEAHHHDCHRHRPDAHHHDWHRHRCHQTDQQPRGAARPQSAPLRIPATPPAEASPMTTRPSWAHNSYDYDDDDGMVVRRASGTEAAIVPPHVLAARRCAEERRVTSSVCVGHGRTLKGRDLRAVRNVVLHMTGFLSSSDEY